MCPEHDAPQGSRYAYQIANALDGDKDDPLYLLVHTPRNLAERMANGGGNSDWKESLEDLWNLLYNHKVWIRRIVSNARFAEDVRAEWERSTCSLVAALNLHIIITIHAYLYKSKE